VALHDRILYAFAIRDDGAIMFKRLFVETGGLLTDPWAEVPGGGRTDGAVSAAVVNGRLVLAAKGIQDQQIYLNELSPAGRVCSGWHAVPGGGQTDRTPAVQDGFVTLQVAKLRNDNVLYHSLPASTKPKSRPEADVD